LAEEALENAKEIKLYDLKTFILEAGYLIVIILQTNRLKDRERLLKFFEEAEFSEEKFNTIIKKFNLIKEYKIFRKKYYD